MHHGARQAQVCMLARVVVQCVRFLSLFMPWWRELARTEQASQTVRSRDPLLACAPLRQRLGAARAGVNSTVAGRGRDAAKGATISAFLATLLFLAVWAVFVYSGRPVRSASSGPSCPAESARINH